jgi:hypothetical protein
MLALTLLVAASVEVERRRHRVLGRTGGQDLRRLGPDRRIWKVDVATGVIGVEVAVDDDVDLPGLNADAGQDLDDRRADDLELLEILRRQPFGETAVDEDRGLRMPDEPRVDHEALAWPVRFWSEETANDHARHDRMHRFGLSAGP